MKKQFPEDAIRRLEDAIPGVTDEEVAELLTELRRDFQTAEKPKRAGKTAAVRCDRATALAKVCKAQADLDATIVRARKISIETRKKLLFGIISEARRAFAMQTSHTTEYEGGVTLVLSGSLLGSKEKIVRIKVKSMDISDQTLRKATNWSAVEAARLAETYAIKIEWAIVFLYLDEGFSPRPGFSYTIEKRTDYPGLSRLHLDIDPHLSPEEVASAYAEAQREAGFGSRRTQREKTYGLATLCAGWVGVVSWYALLHIWDNKCLDNGFHDWIYNRTQKPPTDALVYQFTRDAKHAIKSMLHQ
jgi:hypothetical protein